MTSKKKPVFNPKLKGLFEEIKRQNAVTSKDIAAALSFSQQNVTNISGKLDNVKLSDVVLIAEALKIDPVSFITDIMTLSEVPNTYNGWRSCN